MNIEKIDMLFPIATVLLLMSAAEAITSPPTVTEDFVTTAPKDFVTKIFLPEIFPNISDLKEFLLNVDEQMMVEMAAERVLLTERKDEFAFLVVDTNVSRSGSSTSQHSQATFSKLENILKGRDNRINVIKINQAILIKNPPKIIIPDLVQIGFGTPRPTCEDECPCNGNYKYRTADGHCNNLVRSRWGMMSIPFRRWLQPDYSDGVSLPRTEAVSGGPLPSARLVSTTVHLPSDESDQLDKFTHMLMQWGQFLDHDLTSTPTQQIPNGPYTTSAACCQEFFFGVPNIFQDTLNQRPQCFPIMIPDGDRHFDTSCMNFVRSVQVPNINCTSAPVEQLNQITAYIDGSNVYGSSQEEQNELRTFVDGKLKNSPDEDLLPPETIEPPTCPFETPADFCFCAGDRRVNENPTLQSMHTIWMRMHNQIAIKLKELNCHWDDEKLFQEARKIVGAMMQVITYKEFLPIVLGSDIMNEFNLNVGTGPGHTTAYSPLTDASIRNAFATAAYRFGHSMIRSNLGSFDTDYTNLGEDRLSDVFGSTHPINSVPDRDVGHYTRGLVEDCVQNVDCKLTTEVTDNLFKDEDGKSFDLAALNIQRGRDHGLPPYNKFREFCGLGAAKDFVSLTPGTHDVENIVKLRNVYKDVNDVDLFPGGLTETPVDGGLVGPTFACLLGHQFQALKEGDRFWFEENNDNVKFAGAQVELLRKITLSHIICFATDTDSIQKNAFIKDDPIPCDDLEELTLDPWKENLGEWSTWSVWGPCKDGVQTRSRECRPCCGCEGPNSEARACNQGPCGWSKWAYWSQCKHDFTYRIRECKCPGCGTEVDKCEGGFLPAK